MVRPRRCLRCLFVVCLAFPLMGVNEGFADYRVIDVADGATVKGQVVWTGAVPELPPIKVFADLDSCGTQVASPVLRIDPATHGLEETLVYLERVEQGKAPESSYRVAMGERDGDPATRQCQFQQQVFPFVRTSDLTLINHESVLHNPHVFSEKHSSLFNLALPTAGREITARLPRARGVGLRLQCDVHVHMNAWAAALEHPYFAVTDAQGRFEIGNIPPGTYTLVAWHAGYNIVRFIASRPLYDDPHILRQTIELSPKAQVERRFEFPARPVEVEWKVAGGEEGER
ncbi:carboxypeptidase regulatory-like domain-containing protein [Nitrospirales bacterium NOB]|nr:MAG: hypothetical protein UZ03_NOB001003147 [Nitrospira sp. OLB3]MBV6471360.1 hypothetical protein [Nitrospirota bacterium]MCK6492255.1 carboxypeptidase-like regulatory domain-containing protein [Nitrospira sp.]MDL1890162.1 carboxypeptidase regulatory-like domain-containing protein [Nitrospirales bacterium NOB]MEB2339098.1 carboxypeptidase-like regulatory domain-containing protein [Nitrospirales bacterium]